GDSHTVHNVELGLLERRCHLVLDYLDSGAVTNGIGSLFEGLNAANIEAHRSVELERLTTGGGLRTAEEYTDLFTQLVNEDSRGLGLVQHTGQLAEGLRHEASLETDV